MQPPPGADRIIIERYCQVIELLTAGPISGPDGIPILICLSSNTLGTVPKERMPKPWRQAIAAERTPVGQAIKIQMTACLPQYAHAYTMSGPTLRLRHRFVHNRFGPSESRLTYVLALAEDIRSRGVQALTGN